MKRLGCLGIASVVGIYAILLGYGVVVVYPMIWMLYTSLKRDDAIFANLFQLPDFADLRWVNYRNAWVVAKFGVTSGTVCWLRRLRCCLCCCSRRWRPTPWRGFLPRRQATALLLPGGAHVAGADGHRTPVLPDEVDGAAGDASRLAARICRLRAALRGVRAHRLLPLAPGQPSRIAVIDGANELQAFWHIMRPLAKPGLVTVAIFSFLGTWNEFFMAFIFLSGEGATRFRTLPLGLANIAIVSQHGPTGAWPSPAS